MDGLLAINLLEKERNMLICNNANINPLDTDLKEQFEVRIEALETGIKAIELLRDFQEEMERKNIVIPKRK